MLAFEGKHGTRLQMKDDKGRVLAMVANEFIHRQCFPLVKVGRAWFANYSHPPNPEYFSGRSGSSSLGLWHGHW